MIRISTVVLFALAAGWGRPAAAQARPDFNASLTVRGASPKYPLPVGSRVTLGAKVCNRGGVTGTAGVGLYLDATFTTACTNPDEGLLGEDTLTLPPAPAGCVSGVIDLGVLPVGRYRFGLKADHRCRVTEPNERDNASVGEVTVGFGRADISPRYKARVLGGGRVAYDITLCLFTNAVRPFQVKLFATPNTTDPQPTSCYTPTTPPLAVSTVELPLGCSSITVTAYRPVGRTERVCIGVDTTCVVPERDERDNVKCATYTVR